MPYSSSKHKPMDVLLFSCEETLEYQIVPHLQDSGADLRKVHVFDFDEEDFILSEDYLEDLKTAIIQYDAKLVVLDPVIELMGGGNINHANVVRQALAPLKDLARSHGISIVMVHHQKKGALSDASDGAMGSADFRNLVRAAMFVMHEPGSRRETVCVAHEKHNLSAGPGDTLRFEFDEGKINWLGTSPYTANDLIAESHLPPHELDMVNDATMWLRYELQPVGFSHKFSTIYNNAKGAGINKSHLFLAKTRLGVDSIQRDDGIYWHLTGDTKMPGAEPKVQPVQHNDRGMEEADRSGSRTRQKDHTTFDIPALGDWDDEDIWSIEKCDRELI